MCDKKISLVSDYFCKIWDKNQEELNKSLGFYYNEEVKNYPQKLIKHPEYDNLLSFLAEVPLREISPLVIYILYYFDDVAKYRQNKRVGGQKALNKDIKIVKDFENFILGKTAAEEFSKMKKYDLKPLKKAYNDSDNGLYEAMKLKQAITINKMIPALKSLLNCVEVIKEELGLIEKYKKEAFEDYFYIHDFIRTRDIKKLIADVPLIKLQQYYKKKPSKRDIREILSRINKKYKLKAELDIRLLIDTINPPF